MPTGPGNCKELGVPAAEGGGAEGNEAREKHGTTMRPSGRSSRPKCPLASSLLPASGGGKGVSEGAGAAVQGREDGGPTRASMVGCG